MAIQNDLQNAELAYLLFPFEQYSNLNGKPLVGGHIQVFEAGTSNKYITYQDWNGDSNPFKIPIPEDGRIVALADPSLAYDVYVYDSFNNLVCSRLNVQCNVPGNISIKGADTRIKNTDGTLDISLQTQSNNVREYTINTRNKILDVQEPLYFVENSTTATVIGISGGTVPAGTMNESALGYQDGQITGYNGSALGGNSTLTLRTNGIKDGTYDTLGTYTPQGGAKNIDIPREVYTFTIGNNSCFYNDVIMAYLNSKVVVALEIESWYEDGQQKQNVYENFAQKQFWGNNNFYNGGYVNFVRVDVEKNQIVTWKCEPETQGSITGYAKWTKTVTDLVSGGLFIAEYGNPGTTYEEIDAAFNAGKTIIAHKKDSGSNIDKYYQLCEIRKYPEHTPNVDCYVFVNCYSYVVEELFRFQSNWSNMETRLATWEYVDQQISAGNFATKEYVDSATSSKMDVTGMTAYQPSGDYATHDDLTAYQPVGDYYSASNPSGFITNDALTGLQPSGDYVTHDEMTGYQPAGDYYSASNPSGFITNDAITGLQPSGDYATHDDLTAYATTALVSSVSSELYSAVSSISGDYELVAGSGVELVDDPTAKTTTINVTAHGGNKEVENIVTANSGTWNTVSDKLDTTAFSTVSGSFLTAHQDISNLMPKSESANFYPMTGNPSGFISEVPDTYLQNTDLTISDGKITEISGVSLSAGDELPSGVMNTSALEYNAVNEISGYNGSAIAQYGAEKQWLIHDDTLVHAANSAQYALGVNLSAVSQLLGVDETVLWSGSLTWGQTAALSDSVKNYDRIRFYIEETNRHRKATNELVLTDISNANLREFALNMQDATTSYFGNYFTVYDVNEAGDSLTSVSGRQWWYSPWTSTGINGSTDRGLILTRVVGIGRKA